MSKHKFVCPHCGSEINPTAMLGQVKNEKRAAASRKNGLKNKPQIHVARAKSSTGERFEFTGTPAELHQQLYDIGAVQKRSRVRGISTVRNAIREGWYVGFLNIEKEEH
jgi:hypothetical protein